MAAVNGPDRRRAILGAAVLVAALGATLLGYRRVGNPQPIGTLAATATVAGGFLLACLGAGRWVPRLLATDEQSLEVSVLQVAGGALTLAGVAFLLATVSLLRPMALLTVACAAALAGLAALRRAPAFTLPRGAPGVLLAAAAVVTFLPLAVPSGFYDQLNYHLAFPYHWLRHGRMVLFPGHDFSYLPANMGLLFTYALAAGPPWTAQVVHWAMGVLAVATVAAVAARLAGARGGAWGAAVLATTPAVLRTATWAAADLGATAFAGGAWLAALRAAADPRRAWRPTLLAGLLAGAAVGVKALALGTVLAPLVAAVLLLPSQGERFRELLPRLQRTGLLLAAAALAVAPWLVRNALAAGHPFFPFAGNTAMAGVSLEDGLRLPGADPASVRRWFGSAAAAVLLGTFSPRGVAGDVGPVYLGMLPLALLGFATERRRPAAWLGIGLLAGVLAWSVLPQLGRYLLAPLALAAALAGAAFARLEAALGGALRRASQALVILAMGWGVVGGLSPLALQRTAAALGLWPVEEVVASETDYWAAARFVNEKLPADAKLLLVAEARSLYFDRDLVVQDPFHVPLLTALADSLGSAQAVARELHRRGITHLVFNAREARRIAAMNRRGAYFTPATPAGQAALADFFENLVEPLFQAREVRVFRLKPLQERNE